MINILFCGNHKVFDGFLSTSLSIFKRTETKEPFNITIFTMDVSHLNPQFTPITDEQIAFLDRVAKTYNSQNIVKKVDITELYNKELAGCPNEKTFFSPYSYIRLMADLAITCDKLLYLDCDILFNRDITLLYNQDIEDYEYAGVRDAYGRWFINFNYINSGVLLFNMKKCRETKLFEKCRNLLRSKKLFLADQKALFKFTQKKKILPQYFNSQLYLTKRTVARHFIHRLFFWPYIHGANIKQWNVTKVHKVFKYEQFDDILYEYIYLKKLFEKEQKEKVHQ